MLITKEMYELAQSIGYGEVGSFNQESLKAWFLRKKIFVNVFPIDSWDSWTFLVLREDAMSPFFVSNNPSTDWPTYEEALQEGLLTVLKDENNILRAE